VGPLTNNGTITVGTGTLTIATAYTFTNNGTIQTKTSTRSGTAITNATNSTIIFTGDGDSALDSQTITGFTTTYYNLTINSTDGTSDTFVLGSAPTINGILTLTDGILDASGIASLTVAGAFSESLGTFIAPATFNVAGNFARTGGTFTHSSGTVVLNGTDQTISGSTTFNNLTKIVSTARTLTFTAGTTQTILGTMNLAGASGNLLSLRSSSTGTQWSIDPQGTRTISYLDVKDSNNINATAITLALSTNSGNNTNWGFVPSAPTELLRTPGDTSVALSWSVPSSDGGSAITDYVIQYKLSSEPTTWSTFADGTSTNLTATVTSLTNDLSYDFRVSAVNANGQGTASNTVTTTPTATPSVCSIGGGTPTSSGLYTIRTFTSSGTLSVSGSCNDIEILVVAGGGGGGGSPLAGGGGAGGLVYNASFAITAQDYSVTVGAGGAGGTGMTTDPWTGVVGSQGGNSVFSTLTATGGGGGGRYNGVAATSGGSGGGAGYGGAIGTGTGGQGNNGGTATTGANYGAGGGGGAGGVGGNGTTTAGGAGGVGLSYSISGSATYYAGGGGGSIYSSGTPGAGGNGGGGAGSTGNGTSGTANTGGGGGGAERGGNGTAGSGGSGIVIVRYLSAGAAATTPGAPTTLTASSNTNTQVALSWTAPVYNGGSAITDYVVEYKLSSEPTTWSTFADGTSTNTTATVTGLTEGLSYDFRVSTVNAIGQGGVSNTATETPAGCAVSGGTRTTSGLYTIHTFTSSGTFTVTGSCDDVEVLVVAGGGGGGSSSSTGAHYNGGGGGAGGLIYDASYPASGAVAVTVGAGGASSNSTHGGNGANSVFGTLTAIGGGYGGTYCGSGGNGGSGGAPGRDCGSGGTATSGQGYQGTANGGGGGGAGAASSTVNGGNGLQYSISGVATYYAGGGGGTQLANPGGSGGLGGGGAGRNSHDYPGNGTAGTANTGGGGGGAGVGYYSGAGGSGVVIIRYLSAMAAPVVPGVPTSLVASGDDSQISLSWTAPGDTGGSAITDYVVEYKLSSEPTTWSTFADGTSTNTTAIVTGLTNGLSYDFRVSAVNTVGQGSASDTATGIPFVSCATGGTITSSGSYIIHTFTSSGTFTANSNCNTVEVLVVAGGGGGGAAYGGGGGAGGLIYNSSFAISAQAYTVTVGAGGAGAPAVSGANVGTNGSNSVFSTLTATGGGGGAGYLPQNGPGNAGGSGGGGTYGGIGGAGTSLQGNNGGIASASPNYGGGGGGGAGAVGSNGSTTAGGNGGAGAAYSISGASVTYGGGGGGGTWHDGTGGTGGAGGGGAGGSGSGNNAGTNGTANTGGGGGGSGYLNSTPAGGNGGSGIVIIRYIADVVPGASTSLIATPGSTQVSLSWSAPASNGGSAITDYVIQYKLSSEPTTWSIFSDGTSTNTTATVTGLTNELAYDFKVLAVNTAGQGSASDIATTRPIFSRSGGPGGVESSATPDTQTQGGGGSGNGGAAEEPSAPPSGEGTGGTGGGAGGGDSGFLYGQNNLANVSASGIDLGGVLMFLSHFLFW
jgi:fumarate reductase subunit D